MRAEYSREEFNRIVGALARDFRIMGPLLRPGQGAFSGQDIIGYGTVTEGSELVTDRKSYFSPKEAVFPPRETLLTTAGTDPSRPVEHAVPPLEDERPVLLFLRPCDAHAIDRLDRIFLENGGTGDFYYARRREKLRYVLLECGRGFDSCFCVSMGTSEWSDYAAACRFGESSVSLHLRDESLGPFFKGGRETSYQPEFVTENRTTVTVPHAGSITPELFEGERWQEYTRRCINCGRCNTSCPTCSCFTLQDAVLSDGSTLRRRRWAGCHVNGFTDMAGGHSFRKKNGERMRFKTLHKIYDYHKRFGVHMCVGCGRCDDVCPEYISFAACVNALGGAS